MTQKKKNTLLTFLFNHILINHKYLKYLKLIVGNCPAKFLFSTTKNPEQMNPINLNNLKHPTNAYPLFAQTIREKKNGIIFIAVQIAIKLMGPHLHQQKK